MQKEKLTMDKIKTDLNGYIKDSIGGIVFFFILSLFLLGITLIVFAVTFDYLVLLAYFFAILTAVVFAIALGGIVQTINLYKICNNTSCIVKDELIGKEIKEYYGSRARGKCYYFYFSSYGAYQVSGEYYKWSQNFNMRYDGLYRQSDCGDEFYLVLTKRNTGKILSVYNTQMFQMEEQEADK